MNKKGATMIGFLFLVLMFIIFWVMFLANWLKDVGTDMIQKNSLTGFEAFFYSNINMTISIVLVICIMAYVSLGGSSQ